MPKGPNMQMAIATKKWVCRVMSKRLKMQMAIATKTYVVHGTPRWTIYGIPEHICRSLLI